MRSVQFYNYTIYENGTVINNKGKEVKHSFKRGRYEIRLVNDVNKKAYLSARLIYCLFNNIDYDTFDKDVCVTFIDNDAKNIHLGNLITMNRKDLLGRSRGKDKDNIDKGYMIDLRSGRCLYIYPIVSETVNKKSVVLNDGHKTYKFNRNDIVKMLDFE